VSEANVTIARQAYEAVARGDGRATWRLLDVGVTAHSADATGGGHRHGRRDVLRFMRQGVDDGSAGELVDVIGVGSQVIIVLQPPSRGGLLPAVRANLATFSAGRVVEMVSYGSVGDALRASA
jgi:hypothetical protein